MKNVKFKIPSMQSLHCQLRVKNAANAIEGVTDINVQPGLAEVSFQDESVLNKFIRVLENNGYPVAGTETEEEGDTFLFKTNINCSGCVAKVSPALDSAQGICHWEVNTESKDKVLSVHSDGITKEEIMATVQRAGFNIQEINSEQ